MERHLDILIVHDDPVEAVRLVQELARQKVPCASRCVQGKGEFLQALEQQQPDVILFDSCHESSGFGGFTALELTHARCPGLPFLFVTGSCEPGIMVEMYEGGAAGCVYRRRLADLAPAITEAVQEAQQEAAASSASTEAGVQLTPTLRQDLLPACPEQSIQLCRECRKVRNDAGVWEQLDQYLQRHERVVVGLSVCPACRAKS